MAAAAPCYHRDEMLADRYTGRRLDIFQKNRKKNEVVPFLPPVFCPARYSVLPPRIFKKY